VTTIAHNPRLARLRPVVLIILVLVLLLAVAGCDHDKKAAAECKNRGGTWEQVGTDTITTLIPVGKGSLIPVTNREPVYGCVMPR
jgi:hypothetical protein